MMNKHKRTIQITDDEKGIKYFCDNKHFSHYTISYLSSPIPIFPFLYQKYANVTI